MGLEMRQNLQSARAVLDRCSFPTMRIGAFFDNDGGFFLQVESDSTCNVEGHAYTWKGRKWKLSQHMTDSEIVQTAFKAVLTAMEHEAREQFTYRSMPIFDPHYDVEKLVELRARADALSERDNG